VRYYLRPRAPEDVGADPIVAPTAGAELVTAHSAGAELASGRLVRAVADEVYKDGVKGWIE
jgi:hypothetical protein